MTESDGIKIDENNKEADTKSVNEEGSKSDDKRKQTISEQEIKFLLAAAHCDYEVVNSLLSKNPELLDTRNPCDGYTALHYACKFGEVSILMCLAGNYKANVDWITHSGQTPLHVAVVFGQEEIVRLLLSKYNADKTKRDYSGRKPVDCASSQNLSDMEKILGLQDYKVVQKQKEEIRRQSSVTKPKTANGFVRSMSMRVLSAPKKLFQGNKKDSTDMSFSSLSSFNSSGSNSNSNLGASHSFRHTGSNGAQSSSTTSTGLLSLGANQARSQPGRSSSTMLPSPSPGGKHQSWVGNFIKPSTPKSAK